ncbi:helix-turn-helix domain-containing protein [Hydrogenophaga sp.]|jgi:AraC family ethanolamine operon transcriptional activator|uniref:helix-turn-helix domain-containing protein n=1 Tax=Hydrogenophaga sp. TaxID=1904254 RepID=UPI00273120D3|nr:helix-turn-helix domain-containing protein [Hydrogenophaga sp.]MDP2408486.1 helix-turn-helix domain-containing protein [Hydrogenophaga sp.]MDP3324735.1 helix-turn-helix domain-containing protein [Hydrogenophaga sp.]MDP3886793.1 helix-turn-helix domain-containing protein [Hydrogenophaga sp.]MDZ4173470.1 helix-turn-helix domain-containing protein [Hydrogenophaga sp.]
MSVASTHLSACFRVKRTREVDVHARNLAAWDQDYVQTSPGVFQGQVRELFDGPLQAFEEVANCATNQHCRPWQGGVWLGLSVPEQPAGLRFMGRPVGGHELMISDGSEAFDLQVPAGHGLYGLVFDPRELLGHVHARDQAVTSPARIPGVRLQTLTPTQRFRLVGLLREVLRGLEADPGALAHEASRRSLREALMTVLADTLMPADQADAVTPRQQRRQDVVRRVRELVTEQPQDYLGVERLCSELHITRRTLQNCFQDSLGISPASYLRLVRLNAVRRELRNGTADQTIGDVAARWGFWHMGHFSHDYKALFGETPSHTRLAA